MPLKIGKNGKFIRSEKDIQSVIVEYLLFQGFEVIRFNSGAAKYDRKDGKRAAFVWFYTWFGKVGNKEHGGVCDLYAWHERDEIVVWFEVKREGGGRRAKQKEFIKSSKKAGATAYFVESLDEVVQIVGDLRRLRHQNLVQGL